MKKLNKIKIYEYKVDMTKYLVGWIALVFIQRFNK